MYIFSNLNLMFFKLNKLIYRISYQDSWNVKIVLATTCAYAGILLMHLLHLWSGRIDYGYNMKFNVAIGKNKFNF